MDNLPYCVVGLTGLPSSGKGEVSNALIDAAQEGGWKVEHLSFSDRIRYYWPEQAISEALETMIRNLSRAPVPLSLLSQYLPEAYEAVREGRLSPAPDDLILHKIGGVLDIYSRACTAKTGG